MFLFILPQSTRQPRISSYVKMDGHLSPLRLPNYAYACLFRKRDNYGTLHTVDMQLGFLQIRH
jgi:hypothetical protein